MADDLLQHDRLDRQLLHALRLDPRLPFRRLAPVLGASEQTIARRYRRLREAGVVRVVVLRPLGSAAPGWTLRIRLSPAAALPVAEALARRPDTEWVTLMEGGAEVLCTLRPRSVEHRDDLLLERLPRTAQIADVTAVSLMNRFGSGPSAEWHALDDPLDAAQERALLPARDEAPAPAPPAPAPELDEALVAALERDGRATLGTLAAATGVSEARVGRRLEALRASEQLAVEAELAPGPLGFRTQATFWLSVEPGRLRDVGTALAALPEVPFCAAVSGTANLVAHVVCRDVDALYGLLTGPVGAQDGVRAVETTIAFRRVKQQGTLVEGDRLRFAAA